MNRPKYFVLTFVYLLSFFAFTLKAQQNELADRLIRHVSVLAADSLQGRGLGTEGKIIAKHYIADHFAEFGLLPYNEYGFFQHFHLQINLARVPATNVIGYLHGSDSVLANEYILIGAHYDHLGFRDRENHVITYNGADDNASGVAVMMELARHFSENRDSFKRSLVFVAFDAEESGLLGAYHFVRQNELLAVEDVKVMFSPDMVGMYSANNGLDLKGISSLEGGKLFARKAAWKHNLTLAKMTNEAPRTDTRPFAERGIPAIQPFTGMKSPYHKPEDTYEKLDYEGMAKITMFLSSLILKMNNSDTLVPSRQVEQTQSPLAGRFDAGFTFSGGSSRHRIPGQYFVPKAVFSATAGVFFQLHLMKRFSLQPEVLIIADGSKTEEGVLGRYAIATPLNIHFNLLNQLEYQFRVFLFGGGYYKHSLAGKKNGIEMNYDKDYRREEWGYNWGFGLDVQKLQMKFSNSRSLTNIRVSDADKQFPSTWQVGVGFRF